MPHHLVALSGMLWSCGYCGAFILPYTGQPNNKESSSSRLTMPRVGKSATEIRGISEHSWCPVAQIPPAPFRAMCSRFLWLPRQAILPYSSHGQQISTIPYSEKCPATPPLSKSLSQIFIECILLLQTKLCTKKGNE